MWNKGKIKKKEGKNEEKILGVHLKGTVSKGEKLVSNNGRLAMVSHHCLHLYITSISIQCKDRKKKYNYILSNKKYIQWNSYITSDVGGTYNWKETWVGALTIINWISATLSTISRQGNLHEKEYN